MLLVSHSASEIQQKAFGSGLARMMFMAKDEKQTKRNKSGNFFIIFQDDSDSHLYLISL